MRSKKITESRKSFLSNWGYGQWFRIHKGLLHALTLNEAIFLAYAIQESIRQQAEQRSDGWFKLSRLQAENEIAFDEQKQKRTVRALELKALLKRRWNKLSGRREFYLKIAAIQKLCKPYEEALLERLGRTDLEDDEADLL